MKIVVFTRLYNRFGWEMIRFLGKEDIKIEAIFVEKKKIFPVGAKIMKKF